MAALRSAPEEAAHSEASRHRHETVVINTSDLASRDEDGRSSGQTTGWTWTDQARNARQQDKHGELLM